MGSLPDGIDEATLRAQLSTYGEARPPEETGPTPFLLSQALLF